MTVTIHILAFTTLLFGQSLASDFLGVAKVSREDLEAVLLAELASSQSENVSAANTRISNLEAQLLPMYTVIPKNHDGSLSHNVVRYMLHRFFVRRHGWFIRGLEPGTESASASLNATRALDPEQSMQAMQEWVPSYLQKFLEGVVGGRDVTLRELAAFAATLEDFVFKEEHGHLTRAYQSLRVDTADSFETAGARVILQTYMMIFMLRGNFTANDPAQVVKLLQLFGAKKVGWQSTLAWLDRLIEKQQSVTGATFDFKQVSNLVGQIGDQFGVVNDEDCAKLKGQLMKLESKKPGRVRLADFYKSGLKGVWEFNEKLEYLKAIGTIDESDPSTPLVILPNYVASRPNCLVVSSFYVVCCRNECENLLERLEVELGSSTAKPSLISKIIAKLPSDTITAPRILSPSLMHRLQEIADIHGGEVPLHGRLFAQWMHHAYPRECPYPHETGTISPETPDEWMQRTGQEDSKATKEEMLSQISNDSCKFLPGGVECSGTLAQEAPTDEDEELPWDSKEELLIVRAVAHPHGVFSLLDQYNRMNPLCDLMYFFALSAMLYMVRSLMTSMFAWRRAFPAVAVKPEKCCV